MPVLDYILLEGDEGARVHLILLEREGVEHAVRVDALGNNLSYGVFASGIDAKTQMGSLAQALIDGLDETLPSLAWVEGALPPQALVDRVSKGRFAVAFPTQPLSLEEDFLQHLKRTLREWTLDGSGRNKRLGILKHPYWPYFHQQVIEGLAEQVGAYITLYRGVHGGQAQEIEGDTLPVWRFSSWTTSRAMAKDFAVFGYVGDVISGWTKKVRRRTPWVVFEAKVPIEGVVFAPILLPYFAEPDLLVRTFASQSEVVIESPLLQVRGRVVMRSPPIA